MTVEDKAETSENIPLCMRRREALIAGAVGATAAALAPGMTMAATGDGSGS